MELGLIACLWLGFWIGNRHGRSKRTALDLALRDGARWCAGQRKFLGDGGFAAVYQGDLPVDGKLYALAIMEKVEGRSFAIQTTIPATARTPHQ